MRRANCRTCTNIRTRASRHFGTGRNGGASVCRDLSARADFGARANYRTYRRACRRRDELSHRHRRGHGHARPGSTDDDNRR